MAALSATPTWAHKVYVPAGNLLNAKLPSPPEYARCTNAPETAVTMARNPTPSSPRTFPLMLPVPLVWALKHVQTQKTAATAHCRLAIYTPRNCYDFAITELRRIIIYAQPKSCVIYENNRAQLSVSILLLFRSSLPPALHIQIPPLDLSDRNF